VSGEGEMLLSQGAERKKDKLLLGANGFALLKEGESKLAVQFRGRTKRRSSGK